MTFTETKTTQDQTTENLNEGEQEAKKVDAEVDKASSNENVQETKKADTPESPTENAQETKKAESKPENDKEAI